MLTNREERGKDAQLILSYTEHGRKLTQSESAALINLLNNDGTKKDEKIFKELKRKYL